MLITWNIHDLHLWAHEGILVVVGRQANEAIERHHLPRIVRLFEEDIMEFIFFASKHDRLRFCARLQ